MPSLYNVKRPGPRIDRRSDSDIASNVALNDGVGAGLPSIGNVSPRLTISSLSAGSRTDCRSSSDLKIGASVVRQLKCHGGLPGNEIGVPRNGLPDSKYQAYPLRVRQRTVVRESRTAFACMPRMVSALRLYVARRAELVTASVAVRTIISAPRLLFAITPSRNCKARLPRMMRSISSSVWSF